MEREGKVKLFSLIGEILSKTFALCTALFDKINDFFYVWKKILKFLREACIIVQ